MGLFILKILKINGKVRRNMVIYVEYIDDRVYLERRNWMWVLELM